MDIYTYWLMEKAAQEEMRKEAKIQSGRFEGAGSWIDDKLDSIGDIGRRAWEKTKDMTRAGYGKVKGGVKAVGSHLWRQKGRYGKGALLAGTAGGGYAYARRNRKDR